ncbi:60S ribosomal export protein NMD3, putative [Plasmodium knowlesi strain H]|uniref:60S ribosomal export protein NMD3, putative n=3 Tax=Plasmodium knowlesi TaxID=5850 RepID=A0A5K1U5F4_PLAKH|nr:NMD3-like protein [Plasmodium knowlesi strain H]OTN66243.1 putative 60S ribosomal export protein NMD3 [Plasmodium knowlesi]CAA9986405.1 60S ribosomal export protein NMD3, putative [Plasmodium knowlesi strain H]SBO25681.1 60S ribosomal export protein NMD3, putative [Plasmodium knowlesi strain H]SBO28389.1 60S ribosomal export protein NMD3, putative [Plasmodium knowlesi strain H]VVS75879.1 60S ribosomal export protein NMD3, putative [Plasmodium knowlesi strain H]|eukprot:XP_002257811.1 NMD3-like protein [Plasmodium knowlesi strain H]
MSNLKKEETCQNDEKEVTEQATALTNEKGSSESMPKKKVTKKVSFLLDENSTNGKKENVKMDAGSLEGHRNGHSSHADTDEGKHSNREQRDGQPSDPQKSDCKGKDFVNISWAKCSNVGERNGGEFWGKEEDTPNGSSCNGNEHKLFSNEDNQHRRFHTQFKFFESQEMQHKMFISQENQHKLFAAGSKHNEYKDKEKEPVYVKFDKRECAKNEQNSAFLTDELKGGEAEEMVASGKNREGREKAEMQIKEEAKMDTKTEAKMKSQMEVKTEHTDFEKSYNESLNNFRASSFVDILNSMQGSGKGRNAGTNEPILNGTTPNGNAPHEYLPPTNEKDYENVDSLENKQNDSMQLIACILCGDSIKANTSKMCSNCILQNVESSSANINKDTYLIYYCRECKRYLHNRWVYCELESKELLALCLKKVNKLKKLKILDAKFLYTEPHSKRIKIHLSVQEELINNFISEMELILHYVIKYTQCDDCKKTYTPYTYNTCVSVRQKVEHKKTLLFLESLLLKYNMNENIINIVSNPDGLDFHFLSRTDALKFCDFILSKTMSKCKNSKHLINHDANNNTYNYLYSFSIDICPICKYDLIFFPKDLSIKYGMKSTFYLCLHVSIFIILINPFCSANSAHISQERYNKHPFLPLLSKADSKVFLILNVEYIDNDPYSKSERKGGASVSNARCLNSIRDDMQEDNASVNGRQKGSSNRSFRTKDKNVSLKRKTKNSVSPNTVEEFSSDDLLQMNEDNGSFADTKSCKSSSRKVKLDKLVYAFVELYDESEGNTILTKTCNARHLKPGDYVNAYDLRKHTFDNDISLYLEKEDNYSIIIIDKVKPKERQKIENELQVQNNNIETMKNINEEDIFKSILLNNCAGMENMTIR